MLNEGEKLWKRKYKQILIAVIIVLAIIVIALAAVIVGYIVGNRQAKDDIKKSKCCYNR